MGHPHGGDDVCGRLVLLLDLRIDFLGAAGGKRLDDPRESGRPSVVTPPNLRLAGGSANTIRPLLDSWAVAMQARGKKPTSIRRFRRLVERLVEHCGWHSEQDFTLAGAERFLADARAGDGFPARWSGPTCDQAASAFRRFGLHLVKHGTLDANPFDLLESSGEACDPGVRPATTEEARALIAAAARRCSRDRRAKVNAALYWMTLAYTGLRAWEELPRLLWGDIHELEGDTPHVWTDKTRSKNRRRMRIALRRDLSDALLEHRRGVPHGPNDPVFPQIPNRAAFRQDRDSAGIASTTSDGPFGAHGLRKWLSTTLAATGCKDAVRYKLMRHVGNITEDSYTRTELADELAAVEALPALWPPGTGQGGKIFPEFGPRPIALRSVVADDGDVKPITATTRTNCSARAATASASQLLGPAGRAELFAPDRCLMQSGPAHSRAENPAGLIPGQAHTEIQSHTTASPPSGGQDGVPITPEPSGTPGADIAATPPGGARSEAGALFSPAASLTPGERVSLLRLIADDHDLARRIAALLSAALAFGAVAAAAAQKTPLSSSHAQPAQSAGWADSASVCLP